MERIPGQRQGDDPARIDRNPANVYTTWEAEPFLERLRKLFEIAFMSDEQPIADDSIGQTQRRPTEPSSLLSEETKRRAVEAAKEAERQINEALRRKYPDIELD